MQHGCRPRAVSHGRCSGDRRQQRIADLALRNRAIECDDDIRPLPVDAGGVGGAEPSEVLGVTVENRVGLLRLG